MPLIYTSGSISLAMLEILAHGVEEHEAHEFEVVPVDFDSALVTVPQIDDLPSDWAAASPSVSTQTFGDTWAKAGRRPVLRVPSAVNPLEFNFLLNPKHSKWAKIRIGKPISWPFDARLTKDAR